MSLWRYTLLGETAWLATCLSPDLMLANRIAFALAQALRSAYPWSVVLGLRSVTVQFDPLETSHAHVRAILEHLGARVEPAPEWSGTVHVIPVRYGGEMGPDLDAVARALGMTPEQLVALHTSRPWRVLLLGFAPGFAYLGPLPAALYLPRRATPRARVPAGSVAIANGLTGIYPSELPGGWHLIGRTDHQLFDPRCDPPARLQPGDAVQFVAL